MTGIVARHRAHFVLASALGAFTAGCGTLQPFNPAKEHLKTIVGTDFVPPTVTQMPTPPAPVPRPPQETYSVVVTDVPVKDVLFALARDAGVNVDVSGELPGNVTLNAIDQTLPQILDRLSRQASIRYTLDNGTLLVMPDAPYWQNYAVDYVNISRSSEGEVTVATQIATAGGSVNKESESGGGGDSVGNGSNTKVKNVTDNSFWLGLAGNLRQLITGKAQGAEGGAEGDDPVVINAMAGIVSVRGTSLQHQQIETYIDRISINARRQVLIEVTVVEVELNDRYQAGVDWSRGSASGGLGVSYVGPDLPAPDLVDAVRSSGAQVLVLGLTVARKSKDQEREIRFILRELPTNVELWVGGRGGERYAPLVSKRALLVPDFDAYQDQLLRLGAHIG